MSKTISFGRLVSRVTEPARTRAFPLALEDVESGTGRLIEATRAEYWGSGIAFSPGDLLFGRLRPYLAKIWVADRHGEAVGEFDVFRPGEHLSPRYGGYLLLSEAFLGPVVAATNGAKMPRADWDVVRNVRVSLPDMSQQGVIVAYLDRETAQIDALIGKQERLIETLRERRVSTVQALLQCQDGFSTRLKRHATVQTGLTLGGEGDNEEQEWPYLRVANVQTGYIDTTVMKTVRASTADAEATRLRTGDVLMTEGGDIDMLGRGAVWDGRVDPCLHQNHVFAVRPAGELDPSFLALVLDGSQARQYFRLTARKTTNLASTNKWTVGNMPLNLPSLADQRGLVQEARDVVGQMDALKAKAEQFIALARERRAALITAAVTGQIDVGEAA